MNYRKICLGIGWALNVLAVCLLLFAFKGQLGFQKEEPVGDLVVSQSAVDEGEGRWITDAITILEAVHEERRLFLERQRLLERSEENQRTASWILILSTITILLALTSRGICSLSESSKPEPPSPAGSPEFMSKSKMLEAFSQSRRAYALENWRGKENLALHFLDHVLFNNYQDLESAGLQGFAAGAKQILEEDGDISTEVHEENLSHIDSWEKFKAVFLEGASGLDFKNISEYRWELIRLAALCQRGVSWIDQEESEDV